MINIPKFQNDSRRKVYFISDLHYGHEKLLDSRGFATIKEHNDVIVNNWNNTATNDDIVFCLGDTILGNGEKSYEVFINLLKTLKFAELYLMMGNHGAGWNKLFNSDIGPIDKYYRLTYPISGTDKVVHLIPNYYEIYVNRQNIILSHYPILSWNNIRQDSWMLFGHCHNSLEKTPWVKENYLIGKCMDVGFENIKAPISFDKLKEIMDARPAIVVDHH